MTTEEKKHLKTQASLTALNGLMASNGKIIVGMDMEGKNIDDILETLVTIATTTGDYLVKQLECEEE